MADNAIAAQVQPMNLQQGLQNYASMLGIQQQKQALQTGLYQQQTAAAQAAQQQQATTEMRAGASLLADPVGNGLVDQDGNPTADAYARIQHAMPTTGAAHFKDLMEAANSKVTYQKGYQELTDEQRGIVNRRIAGVIGNPKASSTDVIGALDSLEQDYAGTPAENSIAKMTASTRHDILKLRTKYGDGPDGVMAPQLRAVLGNKVRGSLSNAELSGAGGVNTPVTGSVDVGPVIQPIVGNRVTGEQTPIGAPFQKGLAPNEQPGYRAQVAGAQASATGTVGGDIDRKNQISAAVAPSNNAISTIAEMRSLSKQIRQGSFSQQILKAQQAAGDSSPEITARNLLKKDMANLKTSVGSAATTDAQRATVDSSFPDLENPDIPTVDRALDRIEGTMRQNLVRSRSAQDFLSKHPDAGGLQQADDRLMSNSDPLVHAYNALTTAQDRAEFLKRHFNTDVERRNFVNSKKAHDHVGGLNE
jgi:hypothetical protein